VLWYLCFFNSILFFKFQPNNKVTIEKSSYKEEYHVLEKKLDALSEDKKVINLLYIELNQDYDNPILRKELVALSTKEKICACKKLF
jgi:hypothetical protein